LVANFAYQVTPLAAEKLFSIGPIKVTNSILYGFIIAVVLVVIFLAAARLSELHPRSKLSYYFELLVDSIWGVAIDSFGGNRKMALKHLPLLATLFTFILAWNLSGLLPGVGSITYQAGGEPVPLFRAFTTDLNATLAMAILTIGLVQFYAIKQLGAIGHLRHYFSDKPWHPVNLFIGLNEVFSELLRIVTLSMRLFGVIYAGEVLIIAVNGLAGRFGFAATLPVYMLEIFFSLIQAYVFMMLSATYLSIATADAAKHEEETKKPARAEVQAA
jgi:F-type H+-transporting ATPase subunit a